MKKMLMFSKMLSVTLTILVVTGIAWNILHIVRVENVGEEAGVSKTETANIKTEDTDEEETVVREAETGSSVMQADIQTNKIKLEILQEKLDELQSRLEFYQSLPENLSEEEIKEIAQSRILQCYEENVVLAVEAKTLLMGGLGVSVPNGFNTTGATDNYEDYLKDEITESILGDIGSEQVKDAVKYGINGALEAYESEGTLGAALEGAADSITEGVIADVQDYPYQLAKGILDETTGGLYSIAEGLATSSSPEEFFEGLGDGEIGGLIGTIGSIANYDRSAPAFYQNLSESASKSAAQLELFLEKDAVNSEDIANMMYQYSLFGETMNDLNGYSWGGYYDNMRVVYEQFLRNENMIEMLSEGNADEEDE